MKRTKYSEEQTIGILNDALEQALHERRPSESLVHHSGRGSQCLSIRYSDRLLQAGIDASVGTTGDSYDNALAESVIGLFKAEVIRRCGPWRNVDEVEFAVLEWVDWWNKKPVTRTAGLRPACRVRKPLSSTPRPHRLDLRRQLPGISGAVHLLSEPAIERGARTPPSPHRPQGPLLAPRQAPPPALIQRHEGSRRTRLHR